MLLELDAEEDSPPLEADCRACCEFGTIGTDVGSGVLRKERPLCPLTEVVFGDFS